MNSILNMNTRDRETSDALRHGEPKAGGYYMMRYPFIVIAGVAAVLSLCAYGCMVGPNYKRPEVAVSQNWMESGDKRVSDKAVDYRNWWKNFNDPTLNTLIDRTYRQNLSLQIAGVRVPRPGHSLASQRENFSPRRSRPPVR